MSALLGLASELDARFLPVGEALLELVVTVDAMIAGLDQMRAAFAGGVTDAAVAELASATSSLSKTPERQALRRRHLGELGSIVKRLADLGHELDRLLYALQFYSLNVKIAAGGAAEFVDFADEMNAQLSEGRQQVGGFSSALGALGQQLAGMSDIDRRLESECRKLIPAVPDRLTDTTAALRSQQQRVNAVAGLAEKNAAQIRTAIGAALGAVQIGDSVRQRIEHVAFACELMAPLAAASDPVEQAGFRHLAALCVAQIEALGEEFIRDSSRLLTTIQDLSPATGQLLQNVRGDSSVGSSQELIARLEAGIGESVVLTGHLQQANAELESILGAAISTVSDLSTRIERVRDLGIEVGYMSVNANLRCRRDREISEPVSVIAREIKSHAQLIDAMSGDFIAMSADMTALTRRMAEMEDAERIDVGAALAAALAKLSEVAERNAQGMNKLSIDCDGLAERIGATARNLKDSITVAARLEEVCALLRPHAAAMDCDAPDFTGHPVGVLLARIEGVYTMAQERSVHARFAPAASNLSACAEQPVATLDDDDALF